MTPERWQKIEGIFHEAEAAPPGERTAVLERLCEGDDNLRREIEQLLNEDSTDTDFGGAIRAHVGKVFDAQGIAENQRFGRYQLVRRIGQGGMGAVYEANRVDDFQKKVALKIIKQEFDSDFARNKFQQERQLLAKLEHPYICRLLDGGESPDGSPYLVLEFVDGLAIHRYAEKLDREGQLRLFVKVCEAVEYAHRNLVIHRDLKPANILVTPNGDPKLLDFGIAKLVDSSTEKTQTGVIALTPDYASPEQVTGGPITTASDVYSLGMILYEMLTGRKAYSFDTNAPSGIERTICNRAPAPPQLGDDLDHIVLMALRKEPERRYGSARQLADDIERYLANETVSARPDTAFYRASKYARRHWFGLVTVSAALVGICASAGVAIYQANQARRQFNQVRQLAKRFLFDVSDQLEDTPGSVKARALIISTSLEYLNRLAADAVGNPELQWELAEAYAKVAAAQGATGGPSLSRPREAVESLEKALGLARPLADRGQLDGKQRELLVRMLCDGEVLYRFLRDLDHAVSLGREAEKRSEGLNATARESALAEMASTLNLAGDLEGAEAEFARLIPIAREHAQHEATLDNRQHLASLLSEQGVAQHRLTMFGEASKAQAEALSILRAIAAEHPDNLRVTRSIHRVLMRQADILGAADRPTLGRPREAVALYEESVEAMEPLIAADANDLNSRIDAGIATDKIAYALSEIDPRRSLQYSAKAIALLDAGAREHSMYRAQPRIGAANAHRVLREFSEAERLLEESANVMKESEPNTEADLDLAWAQLEVARGNLPAAADWFDRGIGIFEQLFRKAPTPGHAWGLASALEHAAEALPATAPARRERMAAVWAEENRRHPGHPYLEQRAAESRSQLR